MSRWPMVAIGEVADSVDRSEAPLPGVAYRQVGVHLWGEGAYERESMDGADTKYKTLNCVKAGDIIVNRIWARNGSVSVVTPSLEGCFCSGEFPLFRPRPERLDPQWFYWITKTRWFWEACDRQSRGTSGKNRLRPQRFLEITIPLAPIEEQRRVVEKLNHIARSATFLERLGFECRRGIDALPLSRLSQRLADFETRFPSVPLGRLITASGYGTSIRCTSDRGESMVPILRIPNVAAGRVVPHPMKYAELTSRELAKVEIAEGDLLVVRTNGSRDLVGRCAVVTDFTEPTGFASYLVRLVPNQASVEPAYLQAVLSVRRSQGALFDLARTTAGQYNISLRRLVSVAVPLPTLEEQKCCMHQLAGLTGKAKRCSSTAHAASCLALTIRASIERNALFA